MALGNLFGFADPINTYPDQGEGNVDPFGSWWTQLTAGNQGSSSQFSDPYTGMGQDSTYPDWSSYMSRSPTSPASPFQFSSGMPSWSQGQSQPRGLGMGSQGQSIGSTGSGSSMARAST